MSAPCEPAHPHASTSSTGRSVMDLPLDMRHVYLFPLCCPTASGHT
jgi:hypothetical protein